MRLFGGRTGASESVELAIAENGVIVQGAPSDVTAFVDQIIGLAGARRPRRVLADGLAVAGSVVALDRTYREYFEFAPEALKRLEEFGAIPTRNGFFRSFVRSGPDANSPFAGNLDWRPVNLGPEQALAMQTALASLALRAAIEDVAAAMERVEGKVDKLVALARAERLGHATGDRLTLQGLAEQTRVHGRISRTDWSTVAGLGPLIARDIGALRSYVLRQIADIEDVSFARQRSDELEELTDDLVKESLALLVVAEQNYVLWQELRVAHVATHERRLLVQTNRDVGSQLGSLAKADQDLLDALHASASALLDPSGYEGFAPLTSRRLKKRGEELSETVVWFANQRQLHASPLRIDLPTLGESIGNAVDTASEAIRTVVRRRERDDHPPELGSGAE